jgi:hypothetical protein
MSQDTELEETVVMVIKLEYLENSTWYMLKKKVKLSLPWRTTE